MSKWRSTAFRGLKFYIVGAAGIAVQLMAVAVLAGHLHIDYLIATPVAVEIAVLHNFYWHERFTWGDRSSDTRRQRFSRLFRFNVTTGAVSIFGTTVLMKLLVGRLGMPLMIGNMVAICACSLVNFLVSDQMVFREDAPNEANEL